MVTRTVAHAIDGSGPHSQMTRKLLLLGATGATGRQLLAQAREQGHEITALVRRPDTLIVDTARLRIVIGDARDSAAVDDALAGMDAVLCALGTRSARSFFSSDLMTASMHALVPAMKRRSVGRLIVESALGVGASAGGAPLSARLAFATALRQVGKDKARAEAYLRASDLDWTVVYPPSLTKGPLTGGYRYGHTLSLKGVPSISRADVAHFMLRQLSDTTFSRRTAIVSS
jgi:putative NADH-flavin reductase